MGLAAAFLIMMIINGSVFMQPSEPSAWRQIVLPFYGISMLLIGLASGITALFAVIRSGERSWLVWLPLFAGLFVILFVAGEFLFPH